jgi:phosphate transport system substrate-binding protein
MQNLRLKSYKTLIFLMLVLTIVGCGKKTDTANNKSFTIKGSDTMVQLMSLLSESYMKTNPENKISITGGGSGTGISALLNGTTDICASSREIEEKELSIGKAKNIVPVSVVIANDGLAVVVHKDNPINELTMEQVKKIYTGEYKNWKDLGGSDQPIDVYSRESSSGTYKFFQEHVLNKKDYAKEVKLMPSTQTIIQSVSDSKWSVGYSGLGYTKNANIKILGIKKDDSSPVVMPSDKTVLDKTYSIARPLYLIFNGEPKGELKKFVDFCISEAGQKIVEESGYVKVK